MSLDAYEIVGVAESADSEQVRTAYRSRARLLHPDVNTDPEGAYRFAELAEAYELLNDPARRAAFDGERARMRRFLDRRPTPRTRQAPGEDLTTTVVLGDALAHHGGVDTLEVTVLVACDDCDAAGSTEPTVVVACPSCDAASHWIHCQGTLEGDILTWRPCRACGAVGTTLATPCPSCSGTGRREAQRRLVVEFPSGIVSGSMLRVADLGHAGTCGGPPGQLILEALVSVQQATG